MDFSRICFEFYWKAQSIIAPNLKYSQAIYEDVLRQWTPNQERWLDLGCGHALLPPWRAHQEREIVQNAKLLIGLDSDLNSLKKHKTIHRRIQSDVSNLPFTDESLDLVTSNMVFEHLIEPEAQLAEVFRVLKPGGILIFHTPNIFGYNTILARLVPERIKDRLVYLLQSRKEEDVFVAFYRINSPSMIRRVATSVGFQIRQIQLIVSSAILVMIPPLAILELILIRILMTKLCRQLRTNIIAILQKPS